MIDCAARERVAQRRLSRGKGGRGLEWIMVGHLPHKAVNKEIPRRQKKQKRKRKKRMSRGMFQRRVFRVHTGVLERFFLYLKRKRKKEPISHAPSTPPQRI